MLESPPQGRTWRLCAPALRGHPSRGKPRRGHFTVRCLATCPSSPTGRHPCDIVRLSRSVRTPSPGRSWGVRWVCPWQGCATQAGRTGPSSAERGQEPLYSHSPSPLCKLASAGFSSLVCPPKGPCAAHDTELEPPGTKQHFPQPGGGGHPSVLGFGLWSRLREGRPPAAPRVSVCSSGTLTEAPGSVVRSQPHPSTFPGSRGLPPACCPLGVGSHTPNEAVGELAPTPEPLPGDHSPPHRGPLGWLALTLASDSPKNASHPLPQEFAPLPPCSSLEVWSAAVSLCPPLKEQGSLSARDPAVRV